MILTQIRLSSEHGTEYQKSFNGESWCISELYWSFVKDNKYETGKIRQCRIELSEDWKDDLTVIDTTVSRDFKLNFNFKKYFQLDKLAKKKMQLDVLHQGMLEIANKEGWETDTLSKAYDYCTENNLEYKFFVKNKFISSPDKKYKIGFFCNWDIDKFEVFWVLFDKTKKEIKRNLLIEKEPHWGEFIYYVNWKWLDNQTVLLEDKYKYGKNINWEFSILENFKPK
jgi:hypothetical protein